MSTEVLSAAMLDSLICRSLSDALAYAAAAYDQHAPVSQKYETFETATTLQPETSAPLSGRTISA